MCGIAGLIYKSGGAFPVHQLVALSKSLSHRGPDGEGFLLADHSQCLPYRSGETPQGQAPHLPYWPKQAIDAVHSGNNYVLGLAHRRLSIIDLSLNGHQPLCTETEKNWITFNGEIYNYTELRQELEALGHHFVSGTDTEVLLKAYEQWGTACVDRLNGMWAFCIYDVVQQRLFCSRDRFGVKPFYYSVATTHFAFASEQKAFVKAGLIKAGMRAEALQDYLMNNRLEQKPENFFEGIQELFPGHHLHYDLKTHTHQIERYYQLQIEETSVNQLNDAQLIEELYLTLETAVKLRLRSDVTVGTCLSGGIDSSSIAVLMKDMTTLPVHCFTADFKEGKGGEGHYAKEVVNAIQGRHYVCLPTEDELFRDLETLTYALDAPTWDTSTYAQFRVMQLAGENNIKVVLDGQGADELFAGYHHHYIPYWNNLPNALKVNALHAASKTIPNPFLFYVKERFKQSVNRYEKAVSGLVTKAFLQSGKVENPTVYKATLNEQLRYDIETARLKTFLRCEDRCGMWHGVESRTPFSDDLPLIHLAFSFNGQRKIKHGTLKYLLREAMKPKLPAAIYQRTDKMGFSTPMNEWLLRKKTLLLQTVLDRKFEFVNEPGLYATMQKGQPTPVQLAFLYKLYLLTLWEKVFK
ncbi:MAG: asparagine synthase (glutamine-hydrolyzing) [Sediminibacterium sp.]|nr:asparagine synthase (glutamine-hydrolyzing) [Sediminibacterium sp.]